jgi:dTDP-4-amino-4,6-dideoxygalactose transaminase
LQVRGIKARQWWDKGCHVQPAYARFPRAELPVTEKLGRSTVGLPFYADIPPEHLTITAGVLDEILSRGA